MTYESYEDWYDNGPGSENFKRSIRESEIEFKRQHAIPQTIKRMNHLELCEKLLGDILAVLYRDGGQYTAEHGIEKSAKDAMQIISGRVVK